VKSRGTSRSDRTVNPHRVLPLFAACCYCRHARLHASHARHATPVYHDYPAPPTRSRSAPVDVARQFERRYAQTQPANTRTFSTTLLAPGSHGAATQRGLMLPYAVTSAKDVGRRRGLCAAVRRSVAHEARKTSSAHRWRLMRVAAALRCLCTRSAFASAKCLAAPQRSAIRATGRNASGRSAERVMRAMPRLSLIVQQS